MTIPQSANAYTLGSGTSPIPQPFVSNRAPTSFDVNYPLGQVWINNIAYTNYTLDGFTISGGVMQAQWSASGSVSGSFATLSVGATTVTPTAGNVVIAGTASQITATGSNAPGTVTLSTPAAFVAPGSIASTTSITAGTTLTATSGAITATNGNLVLGTTGNKLVIHATTPASDSIGTSAAMVAGTVTVATTAVTAASKIFLSPNTVGGTQGFLSAPTASITPGVSFVINSSGATDTSTINYLIIN